MASSKGKTKKKASDPKKSRTSSGEGVSLGGLFSTSLWLAFSGSLIAAFAWVMLSYHPSSGEHGAHEMGRDPASHEEEGHTEKGSLLKIAENTKRAFFEAAFQAEQVSQALDSNRRLQLENANLRRWVETLRYDCTVTDGLQQSSQLGRRLESETGVRVGRTLASIPYTPPAHLLPAQLYTLGVNYLNGSEVEKAAVIFTFLTGMEEDDSFKRPQDFLLTGLAWYRVEHLKEAKLYFEKVIDAPEEPQNLPFKAQARLWLALVSKRMNKDREAQWWLRNMVENHPNAMETSWINREAPLTLDRSVAGSEDVDDEE